MKRVLCVLLCAALLLGAVPALAVTVSDVMCVYNCSEWVSLRETPDTSAKRLAKVYLGELVTDCQEAANNFIQCEFGGKVGYILATYLKTTPFSSGEAFPGNQMVVNCSEWVSMRESPDSSSKQLTRVPLGAIVTSCVAYMGSFVYCEYKGYKGYISTTYLKNANYSASKQDQSVVEKNAGKYPPINGPMVVVNCNEWVTLREKASTAAARLARVPLGAQVTGCVQVSDTFIYCSYGGLWGYILAENLSEPEGNEPAMPEGGSGFASLPALPGRAAFAATGAEEVLSASFQGYSIVVRRAFGVREEIMAVCYNATDDPLWELRESSLNEATEVAQTAAFLGGVTEDPLLIWYIAGKGFFAYEFASQLRLRWALPESDAMSISGGIVAKADADGSLYVAWGDDGLSISREGQLRWKTSCDDPNLYAPMQIDIGEYYIDVTYDNHPESDNVVSLVRFSKDGFVLMNTVKIVPAAPSVPISL